MNGWRIENGAGQFLEFGGCGCISGTLTHIDDEPLVPSDPIPGDEVLDSVLRLGAWEPGGGFTVSELRAIAINSEGRHRDG